MPTIYTSVDGETHIVQVNQTILDLAANQKRSIGECSALYSPVTDMPIGPIGYQRCLVLRTTNPNKDARDSNQLVSELGTRSHFEEFQSFSNGIDLGALGPAYFSKELLAKMVYRPDREQHDAIWRAVAMRSDHRGIFIDAVSGFCSSEFSRMLPRISRIPSDKEAAAARHREVSRLLSVELVAGRARLQGRGGRQLMSLLDHGLSLYDACIKEGIDFESAVARQDFSALQAKETGMPRGKERW